MAIITGDAQKNTLPGTDEDDLISGLGGNDTLQGFGGNDVLIGGTGADRLQGGLGTDTASYVNAAAGLCASLTPAFVANTGDAIGDTYSSIENVTGSNFGDLLVGNAAVNRLTGLDGDDALAGSGGADVLDGGKGLDSASYFSSSVGVTVSLVPGTAGNPSPNTGDAVGDIFKSIEGLIGSEFNDTLIGNSANNRLIGANGDDILIGGLGADVLVGAFGHDYASYAQATGGVRASLINAASNTGEAAGDTYFGIERLIGSASGDTLIGDHFNNTLTGRGGADVLNGELGFDIASYLGASAGVNTSLTGSVTQTGDAAGDTYISIEGLEGSQHNDTLVGDSGDNLLTGNGGADTLKGGAGIDTAAYNNAAAGVTASLESPNTNTGEANSDLYTSIENLIGSNFNDTLRGNALDNELRGGGGADVLDGRDGFDTASYFGAMSGLVASLSTPASNTGDAAGDSYLRIEALRGSNFTDTLTGNNADNVLAGLFGSDTLNGLGGNDTLEGGFGADALNGGTGIDTATYANADSTVLVDLEDPFLNGGEAAGDTYNSVENVTGSRFNDVLTGNEAANLLIGGDGDDDLFGGNGLDVLTGGVGNDSFTFRGAFENQVDRITDFNPLNDTVAGNDTIFLDSATFFNLSPGALPGDAFINRRTTAQDLEDRIIYDTDTGKLFYDSDGSNPSAGPVHFGTLAAGLKMTSADFFVV
jgi:Ca2+-binding RTX toxin-like protein